jgi:hypothetical protein
VVSSDRYYDIAYLSINAQRGRGEIRAVLRISYAILEEGLRGESGEVHEKIGLSAALGEAGDLSEEADDISEITQLFQWSGSRETASGGPLTATLAESSSEAAGVGAGGEQRAQWLQYVGSVVRNEQEHHLFKDTRSNRIYQLRRDSADLEGWRYVKSDDQFHYLEKGGTIYLVDR